MARRTGEMTGRIWKRKREAAKPDEMFFLVDKTAKMRENATCGEMKHAELGHEAPR